MIINKPPMGWNSWNTFGEKINEELLIQKAVEFQVQGCTLFEGVDLFF